MRIIFSERYILFQITAASLTTAIMRMNEVDERLRRVLQVIVVLAACPQLGIYVFTLVLRGRVLT